MPNAPGVGVFLLGEVAHGVVPELVVLAENVEEEGVLVCVVGDVVKGMGGGFGDGLHGRTGPKEQCCTHATHSCRTTS